MNHRIGPHVPTQHEIEKLVHEIEVVRQKLAHATVTLTTDERKHALRYRPGGDAIVRLLAELARTRKFSLPSFTVDQMEHDLTVAQRYEPLFRALASFASTIEDTMLEAHSECWWAVLAYYAGLADMARADADLGKELQPAVDFFATGRRGAKGGAAPPPNIPGP